MKIQYNGKEIKFLVCPLYVKRKGEEGYVLIVVFGISLFKIEMNHCRCCSLE